MGFDYIRASELEKYIGKNDTIIIDLRDYEEYTKAHVPTAINIPYDDLDLYKDKLIKYSEIIFYCDRGSAGLLASRDLNNLGYNVKNVFGGFNAYQGKKTTEENFFVD